MVYESEDPIEFAFNLTVQETDYYGVIAYQHTASFVFRVRSLRGEGAPFRIPNSRPVADANMIIFIAEDLMHSTEIFIDTARFFVREQLQIFVWATIMLCLCLTGYFVFFSMFLIRFLVV